MRDVIQTQSVPYDRFAKALGEDLHLVYRVLTIQRDPNLRISLSLRKLSRTLEFSADKFYRHVRRLRELQLVIDDDAFLDPTELSSPGGIRVLGTATHRQLGWVDVPASTAAWMRYHGFLRNVGTDAQPAFTA